LSPRLQTYKAHHNRITATRSSLRTYKACHATSQPHTAAAGPTRHVTPHHSHTQQPPDLQGTSCHIDATSQPHTAAYGPIRHVTPHHSSLRTYKARHATSQPHTAASGPTRHVMTHHSSLQTYKARHATSQPHTAATDSLYLSAADRQHVTDRQLFDYHAHTHHVWTTC